MQPKLFQILMLLFAILSLASCKKERPEPLSTAIDETTSAAEQGPAQESFASLTATKKLQKIVYADNNTPTTAFTYDSKGRLIKAVDAWTGSTYTFTYKDTTVLVKRLVAAQAKAADSLAGIVNAKGALKVLKGYITQSGVVHTVKYYYTYNAAGQLVKITGSDKANNITAYPKYVYTWQNNNLISVVITQGTNKITNQYTYDLQKSDKRGVWNSLTVYWTDNLLGVRSKNLVTKYVNFSNVPGNMPYETKESWTLNSEGYPASSIWSSPLNPDFIMKYNYVFQ